jgi:hypothetical protein
MSFTSLNFIDMNIFTPLNIPKNIYVISSFSLQILSPVSLEDRPLAMGSITPNPSAIPEVNHKDTKSTNADENVVGNTYDIPEAEPHSSFETLKQRIRFHYEQASDYYYRLW